MQAMAWEAKIAGMGQMYSLTAPSRRVPAWRSTFQGTLYSIYRVHGDFPGSVPAICGLPARGVSGKSKNPQNPAQAYKDGTAARERQSPEAVKPASGLYGKYQTVPFFAVKEGVVLAAGSKRLLPVMPQRSFRANGRVEFPGWVCLSFPLADTCDVQVSSLYPWRPWFARFFSFFFIFMTNPAM
ncbi:hypothetical protein GCM10010975_29730 [Comamonas phosphati]|nr:hypothetical protein GCM10010975_29730 [Comamonas phosphati]